VITCPANITANVVPGYCYANVTIINPTATDNCSTTFTFTGIRSDGLALNAPYPLGVTTITWTATDASGNTSISCIQTVTVTDNVPPVIICPTDITQAATAGQCFANVTITNPTATDNCSTTFTFTGIRSDGLALNAPYPIGTTTITWTATDASGNTSLSCIQTVTVTDNVIPVITCPPDITQAALTGECFAYVTITDPTATDNCSTTFTFTGIRSDSLALSEHYPVGTTTITWTATDASGNTSISCIQTVTITDNVPPVIICPTNITQITINGQCEADVPLINPTGYDMCSDTLSFTGIRSDGLALSDPFTVGITTITWTATDGSGNTSTSCIQTVTVVSGPIANVDYDSTSQNTAVIIDVLANDTDCDNNINPASVNTGCPECSLPSNGTITINPGTGEITYTPDSNFTGTDTLIYEVCDSGIPVLCDTALVIITVLPDTTHAAIGLAKSAVTIARQTNGSYNITFDITVENIGNEDLHEVQVTDDLSATFPPPAVFTVIPAPTATGTLTANTAYNGASDINLLENLNSTLAAGQIEHIEFMVNVRMYSFRDQTYKNTAIGEALDPLGEKVSDSSNNGFITDVNHNGIANEKEENIPTPVSLKPWLFIPDGFSPNGDGINDLLVIPGIENYPDCELSIYNRWGNLIYRKKQYDNSWDAKPNIGSMVVGKGMVQPGTYYYILEFNTEDMEPAKGYLIIQY